MKKILTVLVFVMLQSFQIAFAEDVVDTDPTNKAETAAQKAKNAKEVEDILSKNFGAGILANFDTGIGGRNRIKSARVVNGIVRVEDQSHAQVNFMLEAHKNRGQTTFKNRGQTTFNELFPMRRLFGRDIKGTLPFNA